MKRVKVNFNFKSMALVLFALVLSSNVWGADGDTHDFSQSLSQLLNNNASISDINISEQSYTIKEIIISYKTTQSASKVNIACSVGGTSWGNKDITSNTTTTMSFSGTAVKGAVTLSFTNKSGSGTGKGTLTVSNVRLVEGAPATPVTSLILSVAGNETDYKSGKNVGEKYTLPDKDEVTTECGTKTFVGWSSVAIPTPGAKPTSNFYAPGDEVTLAATNNFYAVFADASSSGGASGSVVVSYSSTNFPTAYGTANTFTEYTLEGYKFMIQQVYKSGEKQQWRASGNANGTGTIYNNEAFPGKISSIVVTWDNSDTNKNHTLNIGNSANPSSGTSVAGIPSGDGATTTFDCGGDCDYFVLTNGTNAGYTSSFTINYGGATYSNYTTTCASCTNKITITKGAATGGSYTLKAGSASGSEISSGGTVDNCDANATIVVVPNANSNYHCTGVTASNSTSVAGPDGSGNYTITYTKGSSISSTINVTFAEDTKYTISFLDKIQSEEVGDIEVYGGATFTFPVLTDKTATTEGTCEQVHYHFMGWVISTHTGEITVGDIKTGTSAAVNADATYYAVWAAEQ